MENVTAGQAQWIIERMLADRRISQQDVERYVADLGREIQNIQRRLESLRAAVGQTPVTSGTPRNAAPANAGKRRPGRPKKASGHPRGIAGTLAVLLRSIPAGEHASGREERLTYSYENNGVSAAVICY